MGTPLDHGYLRAHSGLPGPRANLAPGRTVADRAGPDEIDALIATDEDCLVLCGVAALTDPARLRVHATDARWRVREGVAMARQRIGDAGPPRPLGLAADRAAGMPVFERLAASTDPDVQWIVRENRKKARMR